jgi:hypothetical protein
MADHARVIFTFLGLPFDPLTRADASLPISTTGTRGWCQRHQSFASSRDLNFIGSTSGPETTKWSFI